MTGQPAPTLMTWANMKALPPLQFLVEGLLPVGGVSLIVGHPKAGKSTLARVLAAEVGGYGHGEFLGRQVVETCNVLYYSPDEAPQMTVEHFTGILTGHVDGIHFLQSGSLWQIGDVLARTRKAVGVGYGLLIVDTLGRLFQNERELESDSYFAWQSHLDQVRRVASENRCHTALLHHARKSGGERSLSVLGSAAIAGSADTVISLSVTEGDQGEGYVRHVESTQRAGVELPRQRLALAGDGWLTVQPMASDPANDAKAEARAMRGDGDSYGIIAKALGISKDTAYRWCK